MRRVLINSVHSCPLLLQMKDIVYLRQTLLHRDCLRVFPLLIGTFDFSYETSRGISSNIALLFLCTVLLLSYDALRERVYQVSITDFTLNN